MRWPLLSLTCLVFCQAVVAQSTSRPSVSDIESDFSAARYAEVLRKSAIALQARQGLVGPERMTVLDLKVEAHIQLKQYTPAADTLLLASKEAPAGSKEAATYQASARLLRSLNPAGQYLPKSSESGTRPTPIPVLERADRDRAVIAFFNDERRTVDASIERLTQRPTLQGINEAISKINDLGMLETAALGTDATSKLLKAPVSSAAIELLGAPLEKIKERIEHVDRIASKDRTISQTVTSNGVRQDVAQKVGLTASERAELQGIVRDLNTIITTADELIAKLGLPEEPSSGSRSRSRERTLRVVQADAREQLEAATKVLDASYVSTPINATRGRSSRPAQGN